MRMFISSSVRASSLMYVTPSRVNEVPSGFRTVIGTVHSVLHGIDNATISSFFPGLVLRETMRQGRPERSTSALLSKPDPRTRKGVIPRSGASIGSTLSIMGPYKSTVFAGPRFAASSIRILVCHMAARASSSQSFIVRINVCFIRKCDVPSVNSNLESPFSPILSLSWIPSMALMSSVPSCRC